MLTAISDGMVALLKEFYGRGPTRTKSYYEDDLVVCVLRGGFSRVEQTLLDGGRGDAVIQQRMEFQEVMRDRFTGVIQDATGRPVIGFMSGNQQHPDMMCEVFILGPTDLVDDHETFDASRGVRPNRLIPRVESVSADPARERRDRVLPLHTSPQTALWLACRVGDGSAKLPALNSRRLPQSSVSKAVEKPRAEKQPADVTVT